MPVILLQDVNADIALLPDVLFLLGSLAVVPEIKTKIGELEGVTACHDLLNRSLPNPQATAVVTNTCLAFANICIGKGGLRISNATQSSDFTRRLHTHDRYAPYGPALLQATRKTQSCSTSWAGLILLYGS